MAIIMYALESWIIAIIGITWMSVSLFVWIFEKH